MYRHRLILQPKILLLQNWSYSYLRTFENTLGCEISGWMISLLRN